MYLNIPGTPVVHDDQPKDVLLGLGDRDWLTQLVAWTDEERLHTKGGLRRHEVGRQALTISSSKSISRHGPNTGGFSVIGKLQAATAAVHESYALHTGIRSCLAVWSAYGRTRDHDRGGTAVVADREVCPGWGRGRSSRSLPISLQAVPSHQFGMRAFSGPRNIVPTLVACSLDE